MKGAGTMIYRKFQKYSRKVFLAAFLYLLFFSTESLYDAIPNELYVVQGEEDEINFDVPVSIEKKEESVEAFQNNATAVKESTTHAKDYQISCKFLNLIPVKEVAVHVVDQTYVMPSGMPIGIYTKTDGILIIGTGKVTSAGGLNYEPAYQLVQSGDYIMTVNGTEVSKKEELIQKVNESGGESIVLGILRGGDWIELKLQPVALEDGSYKLGIWVRDDMAGVGTLTYIKNDHSFGALGHPVSDADTGSMLSISDGKVYNTDIVGIVKGEDGSPGELTGVINYNDEYCLGSISENTTAGIYGSLSKISDGMAQNAVEVGMKQDIEKGEAYILSSLDGSLRQYKIEIDEVDFNSKEENKGILFHVTDELLLSETGGIVQGMSGSPIIQNGKIVGAVTHVFVNDPTRGYGIFIENMLRH